MRCLAIGRRDVFNYPAIAVFTYDTLARLTGKPFIKAFLNPFNPLAIDVGKADEVSGYFPGRVVTTGFFAQMNARQLQLLDVIGHVRVNLTRQIDKPHPRIGIDARRQLIQRHIEGIRQRFPARIQGNPAGVMELFRVGPDSLHRHADRQRTSGAIGNHPARGGHFLYAQRTHIALAHQHIGADHL